MHVWCTVTCGCMNITQCSQEKQNQRREMWDEGKGRKEEE